MQEISRKTYKLCEADSKPKLARKLCVCVLNSRTATQKFQPMFIKIFHLTPYMFLYIKRQINNQRIVCYDQKSANQTANGWFFAVKYGTPYGGIRDSQRHHMGISGIRSKQLRAPLVSPGLDRLKGLHTISAILECLFTFSNSLYLKK